MVPVYVFTDGRYCVGAKLGKERKRITRSSLDAAKTEARSLISAGRVNEEPLTRAEAQDYRLAMKKLEPYADRTVPPFEASIRTNLACIERLVSTSGAP